MGTKKRKAAAAKIAEAAPTYTARSRSVATKRGKTAARARTQKVSPGEALWDYFLQLSDEEQGAFIRRMLSTAEWREEIGDSLIVIESRGQPTRPIREFFAELDSERKRK